MTTINKTIAILGALFLVCVYGANTHADAYIGTSVFTLDTEVGDFRGVDVNAGYRAGEILEFRVSYMLGAQDETYQGVNIELEQKYGADLIVNLPLSDTLNPYLSVGNTWMKAKASYQGLSATAKDDFATYGAGMRFDVREAVSVYGEYKDMDGTDMFSLGFTANF